MDGGSANTEETKARTVTEESSQEKRSDFQLLHLLQCVLRSFLFLVPWLLSIRFATEGVKV